jgi:hypothetical protein
MPSLTSRATTLFRTSNHAAVWYRSTGSPPRAFSVSARPEPAFRRRYGRATKTAVYIGSTFMATLGWLLWDASGHEELLRDERSRHVMLQSMSIQGILKNYLYVMERPIDRVTHINSLTLQSFRAFTCLSVQEYSILYPYSQSLREWANTNQVGMLSNRRL